MHLDEVPDFLAGLREAAPDEHAMVFVNFEDLFDRKLWHELTEALLEWYNKPDSFQQRPVLFKNFVILIAEKINKLRLVQLALKSLGALPGMLDHLEEPLTNLDRRRTAKRIPRPARQGGQ